jgi:hypothetical protein
MSGLRTSENINGVLVIKRAAASAQLVPYSANVGCPNEKFSAFLELFCNFSHLTGLYTGTNSVCAKDNKPWNPNGDGLLFHTWTKPIVLITNSTKIQWIDEVSVVVYFFEMIYI